MTRYFLGIDIGSTKSHALIASEDGECVGFGKAGSGNHQAVGIDGFAKALQLATQGALSEAKIGIEAIAAAGFGVAGYDWPSDDAIMHSAIGTLGLNCPYKFVNDAMLGLIAGTSNGWGISVSAGTSCNCWGRDPNGNLGRVTGDGHLFGEYGGGMELVQEAIGAVSREWSMRGEATALSRIFMDYVHAENLTDLIEGIARGRYRITARNAPLVFQAIEEGDAVAIAALKKISSGLGDLAVGVARQLKFEHIPFEVVLAGSLYKGSPLIAETMQDIIHKVAPQAKLIRLNAPPVVGSVMLAMEQVHVDFTVLRERLIASANALLEKNEVESSLVDD